MKTNLCERFWPNVEKSPNGCWLWTGAKKRTGLPYGIIWVTNSPKVSHRISWILHKGEIPKGLCVLHKCDTPPCVNPDHLFLGTRVENNLDCIAKGRNVLLPWLKAGQFSRSSKAHCPQGHLYAGENLIVRRNGNRRCRTCTRYFDRIRHRIKYHTALAAEQPEIDPVTKLPFNRD